MYHLYSDWYIPGAIVDAPWPALGRGFNTGVLLIDLQCLRHREWTSLWRNTTKAILASRNVTHLALADQVPICDCPWLSVG